jgi:hypothetical protein
MEPAVQRARDLRPDHAWGSRIYNTIFADVLHKVNALPSEWFKQVDKIYVKGIEVVDANFHMEFNLSHTVAWPDQILASDIHRPYDGYIYGSDAVVTLKNHEVWHDFIEEVMAYNSRVSAALERQKEFVNMVEQVIESYTTLAPALKAWPALWELIPEATKDRHREVKERVKKETTLDVDLNKLTAMATAAKFGA